VVPSTTVSRRPGASRRCSGCWRPAALPAGMSRLPARWTACAFGSTRGQDSVRECRGIAALVAARVELLAPGDPAAVHWPAAAVLHCAGGAPRMSAARPSARGLPLRPVRAARTATRCSWTSSPCTCSGHGRRQTEERVPLGRGQVMASARSSAAACAAWTAAAPAPRRSRARRPPPGSRRAARVAPAALHHGQRVE